MKKITIVLSLLISSFTCVSQSNCITNPSLSTGPTPVCPGTNVYMNASYYQNASYNWNFGDGTIVNNTYSGLNHLYDSVGTFIISVQITDECGKDTTMTGSMVVDNTIPVGTDVYLSINSSPSCPGKQVSFNSQWGYTAYVYNYGDGKKDSLNYPYGYHTYNAPDTYSVSLTIYNVCGNDSVLYGNVIIDDQLPVGGSPSFNVSPSPACPGQSVNFSSSGGYYIYVFNYGDGIKDSLNNSNVNHTYSVPGTYTVTLTIYNECLNDTILYNTVVIDETLPVTGSFSISKNPQPACPGENISMSTSWGYAAYNWNFGDGTPVLESFSAYVNHTYQDTGIYYISVTVSNICGNDTVIYDSVSINGSLPVQNAYLNLWNNPSCPGQPVQFNGPWGYPQYIWNFGDGNIDTSSTGNNTHSYDSAGTYPVLLTIINYCGIDSVVTDTLDILGTMPFAFASLNVWPDVVCPGENISMNAPWGYPSYQWNLGDGSGIITTSNSNLNYSYNSQGTYSISVKVTNYCGNDTTLVDTVKVESTKGFPSGVSVNEWPDPACPGEEVSFNAPWGFPSYSWNFGDGTPVLTSSNGDIKHAYSTAGIYTYASTITNYCGSDTTLSGTVTIDSTLAITNSIWLNIYPNPVCPGQEVNFNTNSGYSSYLWSFGDGYSAQGSYNATYSYDSMGSYSVSLTVSNACGKTKTTTQTLSVDSSAKFPSWMNVWANPSTVCPGEMISLQTQSGFSSYLWSFGDGDTVTTSGAEVNHSYDVAGSYNVTVKITNGCGNSITLSTSVTVDANATIGGISLYSPNNPACAGDEVIFNTWGSSNYVYSWDFGDSTTATTVGTGASHAYADTGIYTVTLQATNSCGKSASTSLVVTIKGLSSGNLPVLNSWTWGTLSNSNVAGCPGDAVVFYFQGEYPNNLWNFGDGSSGAATEVMMVDDGMGNFSPATIIKHIYDSAGTYTVQLTLTNGCGNNASDSKGITITENLLVDGDLNVSPPTGISGYTTCEPVTLVANGGSLYSWEFGDGATITNSPTPTASHTYTTAGNYTIKVTITNGCGNTATYSEAISINGIGGPTVLTSVNANATCNGGSDGSASVSVTDGQTPYTYLWNDASAQTSATAANLAAGDYTVSVTDNIGCMTTALATITEPAAISLTATALDASCGGSDGNVSVSVSNGTIPYTYSWSSGGSASSEDSLAAGTYSVAVTDNNGCNASASANVSETNSATITVVVTNVSCNAGNNGAIDATLSGGTSPFTYNWSSGDSVEDITTLTAGTYVLTVTDFNTCLSVKSVTVSQPSAMSFTSTVVNADCGFTNGSATINATGGAGSYTYLWNADAANQTTQTAAGLGANTYIVTVTDGNVCTGTASVIVNNANAPNVTAVATNVSCKDAADGSIDLTVTGGTTPYTYLWFPYAQMTQDISGLSPGTYTAVIDDKSGCRVSKAVTITGPDELVAAASSTNSHCLSSDGNVSTSVTGGTTPYSYSWIAGGTTAALDSVVAGSYTVTVTDANGCSKTAGAIVSDTIEAIQVCVITVDSTSTKNIVVWEKPVVSYIDSFMIYSDASGIYSYIGAVDYTALSEFTDNTNGVNPAITSYRYKISALDNCGNVSDLSSYHETIHLSTNLGNGGVINLSWNSYKGFDAGTYYNILRDSTGTGNYGVFGSVSDQSLSYTDLNPPVGVTLKYVLEIIHPSGGCAATKGKNYSSSKSNTAQGISSGVLTAGISDSVDVSIVGACDGSATVSAVGGNGVYTYLWNDPASQTTQTATGLCVGTFTVKVTDGNSETVNVDATIDVATGISELSAAHNSVKVYPNPYSSNTQIVYTLSENSTVTLEVYNVIGDKISTLVNKSGQQQGEHKYVFGAKEAGFLPGVYIVRLKVNDYIYNTRIVELK